MARLIYFLYQKPTSFYSFRSENSREQNDAKNVPEKVSLAKQRLPDNLAMSPALERKS